MEELYGKTKHAIVSKKELQALINKDDLQYVVMKFKTVKAYRGQLSYIRPEGYSQLRGFGIRNFAKLRNDSDTMAQ